MEILIKHYGYSRQNPSSSIAITFRDFDNQISTDVTNLKGEVDIVLIESLRLIADELEEQNRRVKEHALNS